MSLDLHLSSLCGVSELNLTSVELGVKSDSNGDKCGFRFAGEGVLVGRGEIKDDSVAWSSNVWSDSESGQALIKAENTPPTIINTLRNDTHDWSLFLHMYEFNEQDSLATPWIKLTLLMPVGMFGN